MSGAEAPNTTAIPLIKDIFGVSADFLGQLRTWFEQNPPAIPVTQIVGFSQFTANYQTVGTTSETTASLAFTDLATVGPTISGLPDGKYIIVFGARMFNSTTASTCEMGVKVNSTEATSAESAATSSTAVIPGVRAIQKTLTGNDGNNILTCRYLTNGGTGTWLFRWIIALRYANP